MSFSKPIKLIFWFGLRDRVYNKLIPQIFYLLMAHVLLVSLENEAFILINTISYHVINILLFSNYHILQGKQMPLFEPRISLKRPKI